jgi:predicted tellurium resistance membrane protein TerC
MMNKWPWLVYVGAGILGWVAGEMIVADKLIAPYLEFLGKVGHYAIPAVLALLIVALGKMFEKKNHGAEKAEEVAVAK